MLIGERIIMKKSKIGVIGCGYVGLAYIALLSKKKRVTAYDVNQIKLDSYQQGQFNLAEKTLVEELLKNRKRIVYRNLETELLKSQKHVADKNFKYNDELGKFDVIFFCVPTNYDENKHQLDVSILDDVILKITLQNPNALIVIKSTIPFGYTDGIIQLANNPNIVFMPEFLREGKSFYDLQHPSRVILGCDEKIKTRAENLLRKIGLIKNEHPYLQMSTKEAESVKLFANSYLAMRVAYFNELDNFALQNQLNTKNIIDGVCLDSRIGQFYNNPSFGFGGYCLEKDTKQCAELFNCNVLIYNVVASNNIRKKLMLKEILGKLKNQDNPTVGIYKLAFKQDSDNYRNSVMINLIQGLQAKQIKVVVFDENLTSDQVLDCPVINDFETFSTTVNLIVANRYDQRIKGLPNVFSRDIFGEN